MVKNDVPGSLVGKRIISGGFVRYGGGDEVPGGV